MVDASLEELMSWPMVFLLVLPAIPFVFVFCEFLYKLGRRQGGHRSYYGLAFLNLEEMYKIWKLVG